MATPDANDQLIDDLGRRLLQRIPAAHFSGAVLAAASGALTTANIRNQSGFGRSDVIAFVVYMSLALVAGIASARKLCRNATEWLSEGRSATEAEQRLVLRLPTNFAIQGMVGWVGAAVVWTGLTLIGGHSLADTTRVALSILLGGTATTGLAYLITEWTIRPVVAVALADNVPDHTLAPGVRTKLLASWILGADVFLLMIGLSFLGRPKSQPPSEIAIWFIIGTGLVTGSAVLFVATRSLAEPLLALRSSVGRVQRGDLDVQLPVNDGGELGLLQAGFNQMVTELRERAVLQDLFGRHVGEDVARQAVAAGDVVLGGERREVGAIFVDVVGSTRLAQSRSPEDVVTLLNRFFATVVRVVGDEGGWVNKFEGDGALAVFGAPMPTEDCAARALRAARTLRRELLAIAATNPELDAAIGVSAGTVVAGNIGAEERYEYTVIGSPVNEASRLTDEAKRRLGRVLASDEAIARAGEEAKAWTVGGELQLRGYDETTLVYEPADAIRAVTPVA
ncbi:MAG: HAMP domain-containing protein [Frankiaceae bacterium]|nr:HAMP domain-containing protein [Frankiaceae bacterium]MBV9870819.1 HAMP domain-containing protein [Frankiaceae bacterium]